MIINDILDIPSLEAGRLSVECKEFDAYGSTRSVVQLLQPRGALRSVALTLEWPDSVRRIAIGDASRFRQRLLNLIGNAPKFTAAGCVQVHASIDNGELRVEVSDTGIGLSSEEMAKLFARFTQATSSTSTQYGGTGLGLAISKQLIEIMGGSVGVRSEKGAGSTFLITLPSPSSLTSGRPLENIVPPARPSVPALSKAGLHILVADDVPGNRLLATRMLNT